ncbi:MAG TPA: sulfite exporter TauE/SafE family protein [Caulobacterales bacterium]|nr:sulfite exporter TauE/SafE family protein [Caulobacterales bacterium]
MIAQLPGFITALIAAGLLAGFIGGLFGVGGGIVMVPALYLLFGALQVDEAVRMHVCIATSLSTIIVTSWRSLSTHAKAGAVDFEILRGWTPWIALGAALGGGAAGLMSTDVLVGVFGFGLLAIAAYMGFGRASWRLASEMPRDPSRALIAGAIGFVSALMGIGGGTFGVAVMTLCGRPIHQAVATASGFGAAIAIPAIVGFIISGWGRAGLPPGSLGFVNAPGFLLLAALTVLTAPMGARLAHRLDQRILRRAFAVFLAVTALNMLRSALS